MLRDDRGAWRIVSIIIYVAHRERDGESYLSRVIHLISVLDIPSCTDYRESILNTVIADNVGRNRFQVLAAYSPIWTLTRVRLSKYRADTLRYKQRSGSWTRETIVRRKYNYRVGSIRFANRNSDATYSWNLYPRNGRPRLSSRSHTLNIHCLSSSSRASRTGLDYPREG